MARTGDRAPIEVEVGTDEVDRSLQLSAELLPEATLVINVDDLSGARALTVRICGQGESPSQLAIEGRLLGRADL